MINKPSKQDVLTEIEYAEARLRTMKTLNQTDGADAIMARIVKLKLKLKELEQAEIQESPKKTVAIPTPNITTKPNVATTKKEPKEPKKETARKAIAQEDFSTSLKVSELFSKTSDFIFFQQNIRLICARARQFDNLLEKNKINKVGQYRKSLTGIKDKCLKIIEHSVENPSDRVVIKDTIYSSWIKGKTFTLNDFDDFLKELNIK